MLVVIIIKKQHRIKTVRENIKKLPLFEAKNINDSLIKSDHITSGPLIILFFHPDCEICQSEITILSSDPGLANCSVCLVSYATEDDCRQFALQYIPENNQNIEILIDSDYKLSEIFGLTAIPSFYLYGTDLNLIKSFIGPVSITTILKYLTDG